MASLLKGCKDVRDVYHEVDHVLQLAVGHWFGRSGCHATRSPDMHEKDIKVCVGMEQPILPCPSYNGRAGTPEGAIICNSTGAGSSRPSSDSRGNQRNARLAPLIASAPEHHRLSRKPLRCKSIFEDFDIPDYILAQSPTLMKLHADHHWNGEIGPIHRSSRLFEATIVLCKLRWLVRLHAAFMLFAGPSCSLYRMLHGVLTDVCGADTQQCSAPVQLFELVVQTLHHRIQEGWPLFCRYVCNVDITEYVQEADNDCTSRPVTSPSASHITNSRTGVLVPLNFNNTRSGADISASVWQIVDDIFICWVVQADANEIGMEAVMQELDFYGIQRPSVRSSFDDLYEWQTPVTDQVNRRRRSRAVQEQGHHLAALLELPDIRSQSQHSMDALTRMAYSVLSRPSVFNSGVRARIASSLRGECRWVGFRRLSLDLRMDEQQMADIYSMAVTKLDAEKLNPQFLQEMKESVPRSATAWVDKREMLHPQWQDFPKPPLKTLPTLPSSLNRMERLRQRLQSSQSAR